MSNVWMYGWEFWLWMGPLLAVLFAAIFAAGYGFMWALDELTKPRP